MARLLTRAEVAEQLRVSLRHSDGLIASGEIPSVKIGARRLVRAEALDAYVASLEAQS